MPSSIHKGIRCCKGVSVADLEVKSAALFFEALTYSLKALATTGSKVKHLTMKTLAQSPASTPTSMQEPMEYQSISSASNAARDARSSPSNAAETNKGAASDAGDQFRSSAAKAAEQVQRAGGKAVDASGAYAKDAVDAAGRKVSDLKSQLDSAKTNARAYINDDPVRAVKMAAIGGAVLSAALVMLTRRSR